MTVWFGLVLAVMGKTPSKTPGPLAPPEDKRGRHEPANKLDMAPLIQHIGSFHPSASHYRREHAPLRWYLPGDITMKLMFSDFIEKGNRCSCETYRKAVKSLNISFTKLGEEECECCLLQHQHVRADHQGEAVQNCEQCDRRQNHHSQAMETRLHYRADADRECGFAEGGNASTHARSEVASLHPTPHCLPRDLRGSG